ncbi:MAG: tyrosine--tRNA ligase [Candidatus Hodarchaeota archaeon]
MDLEKRIELITRTPIEEIITPEELRELLRTNKHPVAYDGFEPSGYANIATGLMRAQKIGDLVEAGVKFKILLADWHAWINEKMSGNLDWIKAVGRYIIKVWESLGLDTSKIEIIWGSDLVRDTEYWRKVILVLKDTTVRRMTRCLTIMGRLEGELKSAAQYIYPAMQVADIFHMEIDICQLGIDQRKANILAREIGKKRWYKPVSLHHHLIMGLQGPSKMGGYDENDAIDQQIASKMSKSIPETSIFVHDDPSDIKRKMRMAFCPEKQVEDNPVLEILRYIIFRGMEKEFTIERSSKHGGDLVIWTIEELEKLYKKGELHPLDLKNAVSNELTLMLEPCRNYFEKHKEYLEVFKESEVTR